MIKRKVHSSLQLALCIVLPNAYGQVIPVLDGYAYELNSEIIFDHNDKIIIFNTNMADCEQPNGDLPLDTTGFKLNIDSEVIGLTHTYYNIESQQIYFTSETGNLFCSNGTFVDTIFVGGFEEFISPFQIFADGFD